MEHKYLWSVSNTHRYRPFTYVIYVTDAGEDSCDDAAARMLLVKRLEQLTLAGGGVFVSLWEWPQGTRPLYNFYNSGFTNYQEYPSLAVNGGFDSIDNYVDYPNVAPEPRYLFDNLKNMVVNGQ